MNETAHTEPSGRGASTALCVSALVIGALIVAQGSGLFDASASADMTSSSAGVSMMTTRSSNSEPLFVVDDRTETLFVYKYDQRRFELWAKHSLPELFTAARNRTLGAPRP